MNRNLKYLVVLLFASTLALYGCGGKGSGSAGQLSTSNRVVQHILNELERLNPQNSTGADETYVEEQIFERLLRIDPVTSEVTVPWLADSMPVESADHLTYDFRLRKGVKFADGHELTGADVIFSLKALKNPLSTYSAQKRNYVDGVHSAELIDGDPYRVRFTMSKPYFLAKEQIFGDNLYILPKHIFDPKGLTDQYSWDDIAAIIEKGGNPDNLDSAKIAHLKTNPAMREFADWMIKPELGREPQYIQGSGPYQLAEWRSNDQIILKRNPNYSNKGNSPLGEVHPDTLIYKLIADWNAAVTSLKSKDIDVIYFIQPPYFVKIDTLKQPFIKRTTFPLGSYVLINWNLKRPYFSDVKVRWALAHLIDRKSIIDKVLFGLAKPTQSPTPFWRKEYKSDMPLISFDPLLAKKMLDSAGWADHDGDGILDKKIDGKTVPFEFTFLTNANNEVRKQVLLIIAEAMRKVGIKAEVQTIEWAVFLDRLRDHNFDAAYGSWQNDPYETDNYQLYHSSQAKNRGSNYSYYASPRADKLLESIRSEFDQTKRIELQKEFQEVFYEDQGNCLLWVPENPAVWIDRFDNVSWNSVRPGFNQSWWKIRGAGGGKKQVSSN
ncbi:MAG TPA: ABC transporter substrate-binding protein [Candidatus Kapabacteria bacterium]|nr:ABC transporter substrate-binding protein [Candidatus Kapabacteria bacterium]